MFTSWGPGLEAVCGSFVVGGLGIALDTRGTAEGGGLWAGQCPLGAVDRVTSQESLASCVCCMTLKLLDLELFDLIWSSVFLVSFGLWFGEHLGGMEIVQVLYP